MIGINLLVNPIFWQTNPEIKMIPVKKSMTGMQRMRIKVLLIFSSKCFRNLAERITLKTIIENSNTILRISDSYDRHEALLILCQDKKSACKCAPGGIG